MLIAEGKQSITITEIIANSLWNQCESLKLRIAKEAGIPYKQLKKNNIYVPEAKEESNAI